VTESEGTLGYASCALRLRAIARAQGEALFLLPLKVYLILSFAWGVFCQRALFKVASFSGAD
jgi:hypothetical protein